MASTDRQFRTYAAITLTSVRQLCSRRRRGAKWVCMAVHDLPTVGFLPQYLGDPIGAPLTSPDRSRVWGVLRRVSAVRPSWSAFLGVVTHQTNPTGRALAKWTVTAR